MVSFFNCINWYNLLEHFQEIRGRHDCVVILGDCWYASVRWEQRVRPAARAVSGFRIVEIHLVVVVHQWANIPCVDGMGLERVRAGGR